MENKYNVRIYSADGDLAQREFIHKSDLELFVGNVIEIPKGIFEGEYKIAAIRHPKASSEYAESIKASEDEFMWTPIGTTKLMKTDFDKISVNDEDLPRIFVYPANSVETYEYGKRYGPNYGAHKKCWRTIREKLPALFERAIQNMYYPAP